MKWKFNTGEMDWLPWCLVAGLIIGQIYNGLNKSDFYSSKKLLKPTSVVSYMNREGKITIDTTYYYKIK